MTKCMSWFLNTGGSLWPISDLVKPALCSTFAQYDTVNTINSFVTQQSDHLNWTHTHKQTKDFNLRISFLCIQYTFSQLPSNHSSAFSNHSINMKVKTNSHTVIVMLSFLSLIGCHRSFIMSVHDCAASSYFDSEGQTVFKTGLWCQKCSVLISEEEQNE